MAAHDEGWYTLTGEYVYSTLWDSRLVIRNTRTGRYYTLCGAALAVNQGYYSRHDGFRLSGAVLPAWECSTWEDPACNAVGWFLDVLCSANKQDEMKIVVRERAHGRQTRLELEWVFDCGNAAVDDQIFDMSGKVIFESFQRLWSTSRVLKTFF